MEKVDLIWNEVDLIRNENWHVDQPCRAWEAVDSYIKQACLTEAREDSSLPFLHVVPDGVLLFPLNLGVTFSSSFLPCDHIPVSALLFLLQNDGWDYIVLNLQGPRYSLSQQFGGDPVFGPCVGIELKCSLKKKTAEHSTPHRARSEDSFLQRSNEN